MLRIDQLLEPVAKHNSVPWTAAWPHDLQKTLIDTMRRYLKSLTIILALSLMLAACSQEVQTPRTAVNSPPASPSPPAAIPTPPTEGVPITLPVLDALLADEKFRADLKS